jgi:nitroimidazol reductase NimA-like FMN-containing flavoprotein (pyridoxamine 5'-phosphate oxidase superfamily)
VTDQLRPQKRGRRIAMTDDERDAFLAVERTCRVATVGPDGWPHATALWFAWEGGYFWIYSITRAQRWADLQRDPRIAIVVDTGVDYLELQGVEVMGTAEVVGDVPRKGEPVAELEAVETIFARKYMGGDQMFHDGTHAWLRVTPTKIASWDFRKLATL